MLSKANPTEARAGRRGLIEALAFVGTELALFEAALLGGLSLTLGYPLAFLGAVAVVAGLRRRGLVPLLGLAPLALFLSGGVLTLFVGRLGLEPAWAILPATLVAGIVLRAGGGLFVDPSGEAADRGKYLWGLGAIGIVGYLLALRVVFAGQIDLIPQEAYYWNYSQHPSLGYLDHPPMVAWLNLAGTTVFGNTEFGVRIGAVACSILTLLFIVLLSRNLSGRSAARHGAVIAGVLPFFFFSGVLMTPDAPLVACWAGALYYLERILIEERRWAWWGLGACIGLGMLSKYTIILLVPGLLVYLALDRRARRWLLRPDPYVAGLFSVLIFSPVLIWNFQNDWASFRFQGPTRWNQPFSFNLHVLLLSVLLLITPTGLYALIVSLVGGPVDSGLRAEPIGESRKRVWRFVLAFTLVPLAVFVAFSVGHKVKLNWTGPLWMAVLPLAAAYSLRRVWRPTIFALLLFYGGSLYSLTVGVPTVDVAAILRRVDWRELARNLEAVEREVAETTGSAPLVVGMDKYYTPSVLAFYDPDGDGATHTAGIHIFGDNALMYGYWFPNELQRNRTLILVGDKPERLDSLYVVRCFRECGPIQQLYGDGKPGPVYHYRVCSGYSPPGESPASESTSGNP